MNLRSLVPRMLLALALVLAQQLGAAHRLGHAVEQMHGLCHPSACDTCLAVAALDKPIASTVAALPARAEPVAESPSSLMAPVDATGGQANYRSRAPPQAS